MKRVCNKNMAYRDIPKAIKQLKTNPELCDNCKIAPCALAVILYGAPK